MRGWRAALRVALIVSLVECACVNSTQSAPTEIKIGGIFCQENNNHEYKAFNLAIEYINNDTSILPGTTLVPMTNSTKWLNAFNNIEAVTWQIFHQAVAIVGPLTSPMVRATQPLCSGFHVPQVAPYATDPAFEFSPSSYKYLLRMRSSDSIENRAIADFIGHFNWTRLGLFTSRDDYGLNGVAAIKDIASRMGWVIAAVDSFRQFEDPLRVNATQQLVQLRARGIRIIILNCLASYARVILKQASELNMIKDYVWIVKNGAFSFKGLFDSEDNVPDYMQGVVGMRTSFRGGVLQDEVKRAWVSAGYGEMAIENEDAVGHTFDAVLVLAHALHNMLNDGHNISNVQPQFGFYDGLSTEPRPDGATLLDYISQVNTTGVMNQLGFDSNRSPVDVAFDVVNLRAFGFQKVGYWNVEEGLHLDNKKEIVWPSGRVYVPTDSTHILENRTLKVVTIAEAPFIFAQTQTNGQGETRVIIEGYCIELLRKLSEMLRFKFEVYLVPDNNFGAQDPVTKEWNGVVREVLNGRADLAVTSLTISPERQKVIDFTQPYMDLGLTVLIKPDPTEEKNPFAILRPFRYDLWMAIGGTMIIVGFFLWLFSTFSPFGFYGRCVQKCHTKIEPRYLKLHDTLSLVRALWSTVVYYVGQSSDHLHPVSSSGRITVAVYWFAMLIVMSTYTANLAAFLTIKRFTSPISSVDDLARQKDISYGTVLNSQPQAFFESASVPSFVTMWQYMRYHHTFVNNSAEGIEKVMNENYAFIWDSAVLEFVAHNQISCGTLITSGSVFGRIGYGFGLAKDSPYTKQLSNAILQLRHAGYMEFLDRKWLKANDKCAEAAEKAKSENQLTFEDLSGVFIVLIAGIGVSCVVLVLEWIWAS
ncbi:predicted protein, partial [Nematostella vectensis]